MIRTADSDPVTEVVLEASEPPASRTRLPFVVATALVALVVCLGVSLAIRDEGQATTAIDTASGVGHPTEQAPPSVPDDPALDRLMAQIERGWIPYQGFVIGSGAEGPLGVAPAGYKGEAPDFRMAIYDAPDGNIIGYDYAGLGFLPVDVADAGTFDATAARIAMYGCDATVEVPCSAFPLAGGYLEGLAQLDLESLMQPDPSN